MDLKIITKYKDQYKRLITEDPEYDELYKWESLKNFQDNWDIDASDFGDMYNRSLHNAESSNLWASQFFYPKQVMLDFIAHDAERVRSMFVELFNEDEGIERRMDHFIFHCDQLRDEMLKSNPKFQNHYHDGYRIISVYLSFHYPMVYSIYKYAEFKHLMESIHARPVPGTGEIGRFFRVMRTIYGKLAQDEELLKIHRALRADVKYYQDESLLLAQDFYWCSARYIDRT